ncbi:MAG TPA: FAD-dependent monooxygenase [Pseudonocardiaceae bacterium]|jgi:2-polyprenyl-6-methoxyphenol hydroxylase-like FAD-dependent oxidoreductase|nr:FAD-dependent monooxygenase [Pseudonocardiaceae bacterium]
MSPAGGSGANTALRDAALLARQLSATHEDRGTLIGAYERQMLDYGFAAVRAAGGGQSPRKMSARRSSSLAPG